MSIIKKAMLVWSDWVELLKTCKNLPPEKAFKVGYAAGEKLRNTLLNKATEEKQVDDPLDVELPEPTFGQSAGPIDDTTLRNDLPECLGCGRIMALNGKGVHVSQMRTPVEYLMMFCPRCGKVAIMIARARIDRSKPDSKPQLAFDVYWGHPVERRKVNERLAKLAETLKDYDESKAKAAEEKAIESPN